MWVSGRSVGPRCVVRTGPSIATCLAPAMSPHSLLTFTAVGEVWKSSVRNVSVLEPHTAVASACGATPFNCASAPASYDSGTVSRDGAGPGGSFRADAFAIAAPPITRDIAAKTRTHTTLGTSYVLLLAKLVADRN
jgi:hypothetical protein